MCPIRARASTGGTKVNGVQYDGLTVSKGKDGSVAIDGVTLNEQQKAGIQAAEMLAKMGVNIHVFQSRTDANGKPIGEHGSYHLRDGSIHIDLNAGNLGQGVMAYTIAHEFTHFMEQQSPAKFQAFTDALFAELDVDVEAEIERKAEELKQNQDQYKNASRETLLTDARSEVVAEACETMLTDTDAAQRIGQSLKSKDATLFEKVKQWFRDLAAKLREAYKDLQPDSEIAQAAKKTIQQVDGLVQLWADMAVDAAENYREGAGNGNVALDGGVKYSLNENAETELHRALYDKNFKGEVLLRDVTPDIMLSQKGVRNLPMSMNASHIRENVFSEAEAEKMGLRIGKGINYHGIGEELFLKIIDGLDNVREAYRGTKNEDNPSRSTNYFLLISEFSDSDGNRINVPVYIDEHGSVNNVILDVNKISTVYGKRNLQEYIQRQVKNGNLIRIKNRSNLTSESQAPIARDYGEKASKYSIRNTEPVVNQKNSDRDSTYMDAVKRGDMESAKKLVEQAAKDSGYTRLFYHGSKKGGGFTVFKDWQYFTENKEYAKRYTDRGNAGSLYTTYVKMDNPFDTRIAEVRKLFQDARMEYGMGELQENGLPDWTDGYDIADYIDENDLSYDSIVLDEGGDMVDGKPVSRGLSYVIRNANQIKSADVITYDDNGKVIPLSERFNSQNNDIRYSQRQQDQQAALEKQNNKLREDVERLRELLKLQGKTTGGKLFKPESIKTAANFIMRETGRSLDADGKAEFSGILTKAYAALSDENVTYDDIIRECTNVAQWLDENGETQDGLDEYAGGILSQMKGIPISLDETQKAEVSFNLTVYTILFHYVRMPPLCKTVIFRETLNKSSAADRRIFSSVRSASKAEKYIQYFSASGCQRTPAFL